MQTLISLKEAVETRSGRVLKRKSAGLAWLLSLALPGAGHLYSGLYLRGALVLGFSLLGLFAIVWSAATREQSGFLAGSLGGVVPILWVFGFLDAYLTTEETNRGIDPGLVDNPRIAAVLNLTTKGFGYFYLGEREKGIAIFVVLTLANFVVVALPARMAAVASIVLFVVTVYISLDAYRLGRKAFEAQVATMELVPLRGPSRLPSIVPVVFASVAVLIFVGLVIAGSVILLVRSS